MTASRKSRKLKKNVWLLYVMTFALIGGIVTLFISSAQSAVIKNLKVAGTTPTSVSLSWDQSPAATSGYKVYRDNNPVATSPTNSYTDTGLTLGSSYKYTISAYSGTSETTQSPPVTAKPTDNPPTVSITAPTANAVYKGIVALKATATDDVTISSIKFMEGNKVLGTATGDTYQWNTTSVPDGSHNITAIATDNANHSTTSQKLVIKTDNGQPAVSFKSPAANATVTGKAVLVEANASDAVGVAGVTFTVDGNAIGAEVTTKPYKITWDSSAVTSGSHSLGAIVRDTADNGNSTTITVNVTGGSTDKTAPSVNITAPSNNQKVSGTVKVTAKASDNVAVTKVVFTAYNATPDTRNKVIPISLGEDTSDPYEASWDTTGKSGSYKIVAEASDASGNKKTSTIAVNLSNPPGGGGGGSSDTESPSVSISTPANNATVSSKSLKAQATASDNVGVTGVQFQVDGNNLGSQITKSPFKSSLDISGLSTGDHNLTAVASDAAGNKTTSTAVTIKVTAAPDDTGPTITNIKPENNGFVKGGSVDVSADVTDSGGVDGVQFQVDGHNLGGEDKSAPYIASWITSAGKHNLMITARDIAGNKTTKTSSFSIDDAAPTVSFTAPANNATVSGQKVKLSASAQDNGKVAKVEFKLDGNAQCGTLTKSPYSCDWNTTSLANGEHSLKAIATDGAGNTASADIKVTVSNTGVLTDKLPPSVPGGLAGTASNTSISLTWSASTDDQGGSGVAGYRIYRDNTEISNSSSLTYVDSGLTANRTYKYKVSAYDNAGNESKTSKEVSVKTGVGGTTGSDKPPTVLFVLPEDDVSVHDLVSLTAIVNDDVGVASVAFKQNNQEIGTASTAPYTVDWDTSKLASKTGSYTVTATATDTQGQISTAKIKLNVDNSPPTISITNPKKDSSASGKVVISAEASDNANLDVEFFVDGNPLSQTKKNGKKYSADWYTTNYKPGSHVISATATDPVGNTVSAAEITVNTTKQTCTDAEAPDAPTNLKTKGNSTKTINLTWDKVKKDKGCAGIAGYAIYRDGEFLTFVKSNNFNDHDLTIGTGYRYTVATIDRAGNGSLKSAELVAATKQRANAVKGDVDFDNHVDGRDMSIVLSHFEKHRDKKGDANIDGGVDGADLSVVLSNFGQ